SSFALLSWEFAKTSAITQDSPLPLRVSIGIGLLPDGVPYAQSAPRTRASLESRDGRLGYCAGGVRIACDTRSWLRNKVPYWPSCRQRVLGWDRRRQRLPVRRSEFWAIGIDRPVGPIYLQRTRTRQFLPECHGTKLRRVSDLGHALVKPGAE